MNSRQGDIPEIHEYGCKGYLDFAGVESAFGVFLKRLAIVSQYRTPAIVNEI